MVRYSGSVNGENKMDFKEILEGWKIRSSDWLDVGETQDGLEEIKIGDASLVVRFSCNS